MQHCGTPGSMMVKADSNLNITILAFALKVQYKSVLVAHHHAHYPVCLSQFATMVSSLILSAAALLFAENAASVVIRQRDCGFVWPASAGDTCASLAKDWVSQGHTSSRSNSIANQTPDRTSRRLTSSAGMPAQSATPLLWARTTVFCGRVLSPLQQKPLHRRLRWPLLRPPLWHQPPLPVARRPLRMALPVTVSDRREETIKCKVSNTFHRQNLLQGLLRRFLRRHCIQVWHLHTPGLLQMESGGWKYVFWSLARLLRLCRPNFNSHFQAHHYRSPSPNLQRPGPSPRGHRIQLPALS
jgi:hypothetical protein